MQLIGLSFFILGLAVASVAVNETSTDSFIPSEENGNVSATATPSTSITMTSATTTSISSISNATSTMNITNTYSTIIPSTKKQKGDESTKDGGASKSAATTPKPVVPSKRTTLSKEKLKEKEPSPTPKSAGDNTGIIILVVIILVAFGFGIACFFARKRGRHYSVDLHSRPDEANIPLSTMDPELHIDTVSQNGLQTFESVETTAKEPQEPEAKPEVQEEQKAEADKSVAEPSAESAAPAPSPDSSEDKPKEDAVEPSPPAPVETSVEEKTDDEGVVSTKTSVESLKEANENNSNNADVSQKRDLKSSDLFWDVPLNCPV